MTALQKDKLCQLCPYPSRPATHAVTFNPLTASARIKQQRMHLCRACADTLPAERVVRMVPIQVTR